MTVLRFLGRGINQTRIRRRVLRFEFLDRFKISRVSHDLGKFFELFELVQLRFLLFSDSRAHDFCSSVVIERLPLDALSA